MRQWTGTCSDSDWMRTRTSVLFGHFRDVAPFAKTTPSYYDDISNLFCGDDSAQHHIVENGWMWALRFGNGDTSLGIVQPAVNESMEMATKDRLTVWQSWLKRYPSIESMVQPSTFVGPEGGLGWMARLSRCNDQAAGPGWVSLPTAFGFVDPLHSSGIAHALSGVARLSEVFLGRPSNITECIHEYARNVRSELEWIDTFVGLCYRGLPSFETFLGMCGYYFVSAIGFEKDVSRDPTHWPRGYMLTGESKLRNEAESMWNGLTSKQPITLEHVRRSIEPWNDVGLFSEQLRNRLAHTAADK